MSPAPDWRSAVDYAFVNDLTPAELAWEFLRRNPTYRSDFHQIAVDDGVEVPARSMTRWGLRFPCRSKTPAALASPLWLPQVDPAMTVVVPAPALFGRANNIDALRPLLSRRAVDGEYWLINDAEGRLAIVLIDGANASMPAAVVIPFDTDFSRRTEVARRV